MRSRELLICPAVGQVSRVGTFRLSQNYEASTALGRGKLVSGRRHTAGPMSVFLG